MLCPKSWSAYKLQHAWPIKHSAQQDDRQAQHYWCRWHYWAGRPCMVREASSQSASCQQNMTTTGLPLCARWRRLMAGHQCLQLVILRPVMQGWNVASA